MESLLKNSLRSELNVRKSIELIFLGLIITLALYIGINLCGKIIIDDAFITYRYARNIAEGVGFVYNPGEKILSTTTPFYTLVLAASYFISSDLPTNSHIIGLFCEIGSIVLIYLIFSKEKLGFVGLLSSLLFAINPLILYTYGMETYLFIFLILLSLYYYFSNKLELSAIFLGLTVLTRTDGLILVGSLFIHYSCINFASYKNLKFLNSLYKPILAFLVITVPWFFFSMIYFGTLFPFTLNAKIMQQSSGLWPSSFTIEFLTMFVSPKYLFLTIFFVFGIFTIFSRYKKYIVVLVYFLFYCIGYFKLPYYHWYSAPPLVIFLMISSLGFYQLFIFVIEGLKKRDFFLIANKKSGEFAIISCFLFLLIIANSVLISETENMLLTSKAFSDNVENRCDFYKSIGEQIKRDLPVNSTVGTAEIGIIGYYSNLRILDYAGLLQPEICKNFNNYTLGGSYEPDYIIYSPVFISLVKMASDNYNVIYSYNLPNEKWFLLEKKENQVSSIINYYEIKTNLPNGLFEMNVVEIQNVTRFGIYQHPQINYNGLIYLPTHKIPNNSILQFSIALDPAVWSSDKGDGVEFNIYVNEINSYSLVFSGYIDPKNNGEERKWNDFEIDLSKYETQNITLILSTLPGPGNDSSYDWAWWGNPVIVSKNKS